MRKSLRQAETSARERENYIKGRILTSLLISFLLFYIPKICIRSYKKWVPTVGLRILAFVWFLFEHIYRPFVVCRVFYVCAYIINLVRGRGRVGTADRTMYMLTRQQVHKFSMKTDWNIFRTVEDFDLIWSWNCIAIKLEVKQKDLSPLRKVYKLTV